MAIPSNEARQCAIDRFWETFPPVWHQVRVSLHTMAEEVGVTVEQFHVLRHIRRGASSVSELAAVKQISLSAISQVVEALVVKGLVLRQPSPTDRRCVYLGLTEAGSGLLNTIFQKNRAWMAEKLATVGEAELVEISQALDTLMHVFGPPAGGEPQV
jgi:DNA-binding MarR family transcriptional regulator